MLHFRRALQPALRFLCAAEQIWEWRSLTIMTRSVTVSWFRIRRRSYRFCFLSGAPSKSLGTTLCWKCSFCACSGEAYRKLTCICSAMCACKRHIKTKCFARFCKNTLCILYCSDLCWPSEVIACCCRDEGNPYYQRYLAAVQHAEESMDLNVIDVTLPEIQLWKEVSIDTADSAPMACLTLSQGSSACSSQQTV